MRAGECLTARIDGVTIQPMLRAGQEVIIGAVRDEQFGPLIMFGAGGVEVEGQARCGVWSGAVVARRSGDR